MQIIFMVGQCHKNFQLMVSNGLTSTNQSIKTFGKKDTNQGFIFEVDLIILKVLWDSHNDYPLAPEKMKG